jgi:hypothetical protein
MCLHFRVECLYLDLESKNWFHHYFRLLVLFAVTGVILIWCLGCLFRWKSIFTNSSVAMKRVGSMSNLKDGPSC